MILFWGTALALMMLLYVLLDGFDLGVGILFALTRDEAQRRHMLSAISPVWDGNETWLVLTAAILFGAFPRVYALVLQAFYLPMILLLVALILRGVAFEFRYKTTRLRWLWDACFSTGSALAAFLQGMTVGALVEGIPVAQGLYTGGPMSWLTPFSCLCGIGLCFGYALLGASWLVNKTDGVLRDRAYTQLPVLLVLSLIFLAINFVWVLLDNLPILSRWVDRPYLLLCPAIGAAGTVFFIQGIRRHWDAYPFRAASAIFFAGFLALAISLWPYMIPFSVKIQDAAAPTASLNFMFWGAGLVVLPLTLIYTSFVYRTFAGKVADGGSYE